MKVEFFVLCLLVGTSLSLSIEIESKPVENSDKKPIEPSASATPNDAKEKRQIGDRQTRLYPNTAPEDPEQPQETIYGPPPGHFLIRPGPGHGPEPQPQPHQPHLQPQPRFIANRAYSAQLAQQQDAQGQELPPQIQYFQYLQDVSRHAGQKQPGSKQPQPRKLAQPSQFAQEVSHFQAQQQQSQQLHAHSQQPQHISFPVNGREPQQFQQQAYQLIPEEELLKLIEEELINRGYPPIPKQAAQPQASNPKPKPGLGGYRQQRPDEAAEQITYIPQQTRSQAFVPEQRPAPEEQQIYQHALPLDYHRAIPNHPLAASTLEKEIEKLFASNIPTSHHQQQQRQQGPAPQPQQRVQSKVFVTTPPPQNVDFNFAQNFAQLSGFKPSLGVGPTQPSPSESPVKYYSPSTHQYLNEVSPSPTPKPAAASNIPSYPARQHINTKAHLKRQKPIFHYQKQANPTAVVYYQNQNSDQAELLSSPQQQQPAQTQQSRPQYQVPAPSQSTIFVSQGTGVHPPPTPAPKASQVKSYGEEQSVKLPPPNGKPITQEEFQALLDAGYPVTAVPVPVPVPYDQYVKDHPEYKGEPIEIPLRQQGPGQRPITYLHPIHLQQQRLQQQQQQQQQHEAAKKS